MRLTDLALFALFALALYGGSDPAGAAKLIDQCVGQLAHLAHPLLSLLP
jgi:hypothetical protein